MDGIHIGDLSRSDDSISPQVTVGAARPAYANGLVGQLNVKGLDIGLGINRKGLYAELSTSSDDAEGDFTAVGDEDFLDHQEIG
jgi:hypothetical protein